MQLTGGRSIACVIDGGEKSEIHRRRGSEGRTVEGSRLDYIGGEGDNRQGIGLCYLKGLQALVQGR